MTNEDISKKSKNPKVYFITGEYKTKFLRKIEDPNYKEEVNYDLPENATPLEQAKYNICQAILAYQQDQNLLVEKVAQQIKLTIPETKGIFFAKINNFTLDRLMVYASQLFFAHEIKVVVEDKVLKNLSHYV
ncbi:10457_t:CDS:2 [Gigaspora rosea]|nr:10457_t:CDS:2 [Gigaspora rosea]